MRSRFASAWILLSERLLCCKVITPVFDTVSLISNHLCIFTHWGEKKNQMLNEVRGV